MIHNTKFNTLNNKSMYHTQDRNKLNTTGNLSAKKDLSSTRESNSKQKSFYNNKVNSDHSKEMLMQGSFTKFNRQ
jgi:hypothetical protein